MLIRCVTALLVVAAVPAWTQTSNATLIDLQTQGRNVDFSTFSFTRPVATGTALPSTCQLGQMFLNSAASAGSNLYACTASNVWTAQGANGGSVSSVAWGTLPTWLSGTVANGTSTPSLTLSSASGQTTHQVLGTGTGSSFVPISLTAADLPSSITSNTTGTAANVTGTVGLANGGTGQTTASAAFNALSPLTTLGDMLYAAAAGSDSRLAGNTTTTKKFLTQTGTGSASTAPVWGTIVSGDLPASITSSTTGNAATATQLATTPTPCASGLYATSITAMGNAICSQVSYTQLTGTPALYNQTVQSNGTAQTQRPAINFKAGSNVTLGVADNAGNNSTDVTISSLAQAANYQAVQVNGSALASGGALNIAQGSGATVTGTTSSGVTTITISASAGTAGSMTTGGTAPVSGCSSSSNLGALYEQTGSTQALWTCSYNGSTYLWVQTSVPWMDVRTAGAKGDGSSDDTAIINSVLAANHYVFFSEPSVCYKITGPLQLQSYQYIAGESRSKGICSYSTTADALYASTTTAGTRYIRIENLYIKDSVLSTRTSGAGIHIDGGTSAAIFDLQDDYIYGFYDGVNMTTSVTSKLDGVRSTSALRDSFHSQQTSTSTNFINTYGDAPGRYCYYADDLSYSAFTSTACDNSVSDAYHFESGDGGYPTGISLNSAGAEQVGANGVYLDGIGFTINGGAFSGMPTGTGMAGIIVNGAGGVHVNMPRIQGGDYAVNLAATPGHGTSSKSVHVASTGSFYGQNVGYFNDPNRLLAVDMTQVTAPTNSGQACDPYTFALDSSYFYACNANSNRWYRTSVTVY